MNTQTNNTLSNLVFTNNKNQLLTTSLLVAQKFNKRHSDVLRTVKNMTTQNCGLLEMFDESEYYNEQNKKQPMYVMNRDGFTLLTMGFTGKDALQFKLDYIKAFNEMESKIQSLSSINNDPIILIRMQQLQQEERISALENKVNILTLPTPEEPKDKYYTIKGYARLKNKKLSTVEASILSNKTKKRCKELGIEINFISDARYGKLNTYPQSVIDEMFD